MTTGGVAVLQGLGSLMWMEEEEELKNLVEEEEEEAYFLYAKRMVG